MMWTIRSIVCTGYIGVVPSCHCYVSMQAPVGALATAGALH
jgi:hypothetical protein